MLADGPTFVYSVKRDLMFSRNSSPVAPSEFATARLLERFNGADGPTGYQGSRYCAMNPFLPGALFQEGGDFRQRFALDVGDPGVFFRVTDYQYHGGLFSLGPGENLIEKFHGAGCMGQRGEASVV